MLWLRLLDVQRYIDNNAGLLMFPMKITSQPQSVLKSTQTNANPFLLLSMKMFQALIVEMSINKNMINNAGQNIISNIEQKLTVNVELIKKKESRKTMKMK